MSLCRVLLSPCDTAMIDLVGLMGRTALMRFVAKVLEYERSHSGREDSFVTLSAATVGFDSGYSKHWLVPSRPVQDHFPDHNSRVCSSNLPSCWFFQLVRKQSKLQHAMHIPLRCLHAHSYMHSWRFPVSENRLLNQKVRLSPPEKVIQYFQHEF